MNLPAHWARYLVRDNASELTSEDRSACDALRNEMRKYGWRFVDAGSQPFADVPAVPEGTQDQVPCLRFTLRRDEHRLLPSGEPVTLEDHLDALQECLGRTPDDGAADIGETAESLLRAFGR